MIREVLEGEDPAVSTVKTIVNSSWESGPRRSTAPDRPHDNSVGGIDDVAAFFHCIGVPDFASLPILAHDRLATGEGPGSGSAPGSQRDVGIE